MSAPFDLAERYRGKGWTGTLPLGVASKFPPPGGFTGYDGRWPTPEDISGWRSHGFRAEGEHHDASNLALRLPAVAVGLDVDCYEDKTGTADLARLVEQWGPQPPTWKTTSRDDGSGILLYRVPSGVDPTTWPTGAGPSIEIIRHAHRYAVVWPSIHPETGRQYRWHRPNGTLADEGEIPGLGDLAELPAAWLVGLTGHGGNGDHVKPGSRASRRETDKRARQWIADLPAGQPCRYVGKLAADLTAAARREDGNAAYDTTRDTVMALLRAGETGHRGVRTVLLTGRAIYIETVEDKRGGQAIAGGEFDRFTLGGVAKMLDDPSDKARRGCDCQGGPSGEPRPENAAPQISRGLPDTFWAERDYLRHIRDAAWSRGRSAEAVFGGLLARVAAERPYAYKLPPLVGSRCGLDLIVALCAPPGGGKSSAKSVAVELLPIDPARLDPICDDVPPGSGEGLIDVLFDMVTEDGPGGKPIKVKRQNRFNAFVYADEGEVLAATARRNTTSTLLPTLRSIFSGGPLGQANASEERKRRVPAGRYSYGVVIALQPSKAGPLFDDLGAGTPQRILWLPARTDTPAPDQRPRWPGPIPRGTIPPRFGYEPEYDIDPDVAAEIRANDYQRHTHGCGPLDEHRDLIRLKVAGLLAVLDDRDNITPDDWSLAGMVVDLSDTTRSRVLATLAEEQKQANTNRGRAQGERQAVADEVLDERAMAAAKRQAVNRVVKHHREHPEGSCPRRCIDRAIASKYRQTVSVDDVLDRAAAEDLLAITDGRYAPGKRTT